MQVEVSVNDGNTYTNSSVDTTFLYYAPPLVLAASPRGGPFTGGTVVTVAGAIRPFARTHNA